MKKRTKTIPNPAPEIFSELFKFDAARVDKVFDPPIFEFTCVAGVEGYVRFLGEDVVECMGCRSYQGTDQFLQFVAALRKRFHIVRFLHSNNHKQLIALLCAQGFEVGTVTYEGTKYPSLTWKNHAALAPLFSSVLQIGGAA